MEILISISIDFMSITMDTN